MAGRPELPLVFVLTPGRPIGFDPKRYQQRDVVERCFQQIKTWRGLATHHDKTLEVTRPPPPPRLDHVAEPLTSTT